MAVKKGSKRKRAKYPGLDPSVNSKLRHDLIDHDYVYKLNDKEKEWLSNFNEEYISGNFSHRGEIFHHTKEERKPCYDRNNARNRCIYSITKATGNLRQLIDYVNIADANDIEESVDLKFLEDSYGKLDDGGTSDDNT